MLVIELLRVDVSLVLWEVVCELVPEILNVEEAVDVGEVLTVDEVFR